MHDRTRTPTSYLELYGLSKAPFTDTPDGDNYLLFNSHRRVFEQLLDHMVNGRSMLVLRGEAGSGKTHMLAAAAQIAAESGARIVRTKRPLHCQLERAHLLAAFDRSDSEPNLSEQEAAVNFLLRSPRAALLIDDADLLTDDSRSFLVSILEQTRESIAIVLAATSTRQALTARATQVELQIPRLSPTDARQYIERMLWMAGGTTRRLISAKALQMIVVHTAGLPGSINRVMEAAFTAGFARGDATITHRTLESILAPAKGPRAQRVSERMARRLQIGAIALFLIGAATFLYRGLTGGEAHHHQPAPVTNSTPR